jgi:DNA-binding MarR family transcriptional regulator
MIPGDQPTTKVLPEHVELQAALTRVLRWASRPSVVRELAGPLAEGLSPTDLWLLDGIVRHGPVRVSDLATWQQVDKSTITIELRRLTGRGLLDRRPHSRDRRAVLVSASAAGVRLHEEVSRQGALVLAGLLADWPSADHTAFAELMTRFAAELRPQPDPR